MTTPSNGSSMVCRSLLLPIDMRPPLGPKIFVWGEPVLRRYLTVYDLAEKRIGFSLARQSEVPSGEAPSVGTPPEGSLVAGAPLPSVLRPKAHTIGTPPEGSLVAGAPLPDAARTRMPATSPES